MNPEFMAEAIRLASQGMDDDLGGPFGALIVRDGEILAHACNGVVEACDPTAHAEIQAIRMACKHINHFHLEGCVLYCSCEPCPMCLGAAYWAHLDGIYYAASREDAANIGFADAAIYDELCLEPSRRRIPMIQLMREEILHVFQRWMEKSDRILY
ncbi:Guanine deaminase [Nitrosococcus halophilus Nc 4]|uniref:Guanine deaminase n=1 Tax=Nitrosococcus halophilus (strain Nc4) TaxID=472759 RepID=D5C104_NITHN|nr:nucleoside deaminase [Nitrosococcus halophilus]ADE14561.1 Guanine deaminase [Nitrosococcus halophilus Nc 4]